MMKKILLFIFINAILISCKTNLPKENDFGIKGYFNKITTIKSRFKTDSLGNKYKDTISVFITTVNRKGKAKQMISKVYINNKVTQTIRSKFNYNSKGQLISEVTQPNKDENGFTVNYFYKNDLLNEIITRDSIDDFLIDFYEKYTYDSNGKLKFRESKQFTYEFIEKDTSDFQIIKFSYDNNEFQIESDWTDIYNDYPNFKEYYTNDSLGLLIKTVTYDKISQRLDSTIYNYEYDSKNNWIKRKSYKNDTQIQLTERIIK